ncbi:antibiotic biosynthesis monooxygenase [Paenalkalicoccus suaedae]|uniref:Antibiotic biosynthesis monooxygenase n=1 Tax=Paenalkalicoccus suaedae TaxID=2592382 RepID=A0A859FD29_9BACI|nr:antibiotic biosynthesis monooxygenase family protein [Paenalkalicoccus suaedae]QKS70126.1 antibiotic biosynthesis monooxygenase [Paenalkalicoccus suaedae]
MYTVFSTFLVPDHKADEVIGLYQKRSRRVDKAPGFLDFLLLQNEKKPGEITVQLFFTDKDSYLTWVRSSEFKRIHELEKKYPDQELANIVPKVTQHQVVAR